MGNPDRDERMAPEELLRKVHSVIDSCFARGLELKDVLQEVENYIASFEI